MKAALLITKAKLYFLICVTDFKNLNAVIFKWIFFSKINKKKSHLETTFDTDNIFHKETELYDSRKIIKPWQVSHEPEGY